MRTGTKLLKLRPYKITVVHSASTRFSNLTYCLCHLESVQDVGEFGPELTFFRQGLDVIVFCEHKSSVKKITLTVLNGKDEELKAVC